MHTKFWSENLKERVHLRDLGSHGRILCRMALKEISCDGVAWINLADREQWWALLSTVMNLPVPCKVQSFLIS
jgi:hypothetical protein